jgi:hypothetical protein
MAFSDSHYPDVLTTFGLTVEAAPDLFAGVPGSEPSAGFEERYAVGARLANTLNNEKARSEWMIAPVRSEFWWRYRGWIGLYSGADFTAAPAAGRTGFCDFLLSRPPSERSPRPRWS